MTFTTSDVVAIVSSFLFFGVIRYLLQYFSCSPPAVSLSCSKSIRWRWFNVSISFMHGVFAGVGCLYCLYDDPLMIEDLKHRHTFLPRILIATSTGYFFYDVLDHIIGCFSVAVFVHHILVIGSFSVVVYSKVYVAYATVALLTEVNSIFLHLRQLLRMSKVSDQSTLYLANSVINFATFIVFRFFTLIWMSWWLRVHQDTVVQPYFSILLLSLPLMLIINAVLLYQVLAKDFPSFTIKLRKENVSTNGMQNGTSNTNRKID